IEAGRPIGKDETTKKFFRFAVNLNKYRSSISATNVIRRGIEVLGGNGAMENFSVLPRLLRDSVIFEAWEGAHGTLIAQSVRDCQRSKLHESYFDFVRQMFDSIGNAELKARGQAKLESLRNELEPLLAMDELSAGVFFRGIADRMVYLFYVARLTVEADQENGKALGKSTVIEWLWQHGVEKGAAEVSVSYLRQISEISSIL
ncbi:MAG: hypothetical protein M3X11_22155, partial [Acidobacteriota bacterium]|nr:hypothetical protein [Acidobacteriota bacterium]